MHSIVWWSNLLVLLTASVIDVRTRRIPNWLVVPFLVSGMAYHGATGGWRGAAQTVAGIGLAAILFGVPAFLRGMGMGDLKLAAGVGAWIGPQQLFFAFVLTGIIGASMAVGAALLHGSLGKCLDNAGTLVAHISRSGFRRHATVSIDNPTALSIPYAPAIAIGTLLSFAAR